MSKLRPLGSQGRQFSYGDFVRIEEQVRGLSLRAQYSIASAISQNKPRNAVQTLIDFFASAAGRAGEIPEYAYEAASVGAAAVKEKKLAELRAQTHLARSPLAREALDDMIKKIERTPEPTRAEIRKEMIAAGISDLCSMSQTTAFEKVFGREGRSALYQHDGFDPESLLRDDARPTSYFGALMSRIGVPFSKDDYSRLSPKERAEWSRDRTFDLSSRPDSQRHQDGWLESDAMHVREASWDAATRD